MMRGQRLVALLLGGLLAGAAHAQPGIYVCTDAAGRTYSGDRPPAECSDRVIRELRTDGSIRRLIDPPLTPEQKAIREAESRQKKELAEREREQARRDRVLLEMYADLDDVEVARKRALADRNVQLDRSRERMQSLLAERKRLDQEAEFFVGRSLPDKLKRAYAAVEELEQNEINIVREVDNDARRINQRFDADRERLTELLAAGHKSLKVVPRGGAKAASR